VAFNAYVDIYNTENAAQIAAGDLPAKDYSSEDFIFKASGIERRYVIDKKGILDPNVMHPLLRQRSDDEPSQMAEMALDAAQKALQAAGKTAADVDAVQPRARLPRRCYRHPRSFGNQRLRL
jgi:beta-ketodecanoyl-[acyl-carrier-protein] synthase